MLGAEEQSQQVAACRFAVGSSQAVLVLGRKNLRTPDAYRRCDERPDLIG